MTEVLEKELGRLTPEAIQFLDALKKDNPKVRDYLLESFAGLPNSPELKKETQAYFVSNSSGISATVITNPGSSVISESLYEREPTSSLIDNYFFQSQAGRAVKARLEAVKNQLPRFIEEVRKKKGKVLIGNLGSGPGRDVIDVLATYFPNNANIRAVHVDNDPMALERGKRMAKIKGVENSIEFVEADLVRYKPAELFDIILLIGIICTLDSGSCSFYLRLIKKKLKPGGILIVSNVAKEMLEKDPFTCHIMNHIGNWEMVYKDEKEMKAILEDAGYLYREYFTDEFGFHIIAVGSLEEYS